MPVKSSEITSEKVYNRRRVLIAAGLGVLAVPLLDKGYGALQQSQEEINAPFPPVTAQPNRQNQPLEATPYETVTGYNNYYEFGYSKDDPANAAKTLMTSPWSVEIGGEGANKPGIYDIAEIKGEHSIENHLYRFRCVEAWSMVIPWNGIKLADIIKAAAPNSKAKFVRFTTLNDPQQMPNADWAGGPYTEGLTIAEAMNPLALLTTGIYDKPLEQQTGAPIRLVVPWKYGFYANVHPGHDHPRWSQRSERIIGEYGRQRTQLYNGCADEVAHLYGALSDRRYFY